MTDYDSPQAPGVPAGDGTTPDAEWVRLEPPDECECGAPADQRPLTLRYDGDSIDWVCPVCLAEWKQPSNRGHW